MRVVGAAFTIQALIIGGLFGYGVFLKILEDELGWSRTLLSGAPSVAFLVMGLLAFAGGRLNDLYGPRWVLSVTGLVTGLGYILISRMQEPWQLLLFFGVFIGIGLSTHDVVTLSTVASWYQKRRGLMTGIVKTGTACGQLAFPIIVTFLIVAYGWRQAMMFLGVAMIVLLVLLAQCMRRPTLQESASNLQSAVRMDGMTQTQARGTRTLWILCFVQFCYLPALMSVPLHMVAHATDLGMTTERAATVLSVMGGSSIAGRLAIGFLLDRLGGKRALLVCLLPLMLSLLAFRFNSGHGLLYLVAIIYGISHGGLFTVMSPTVAEFFGMKAHGAIFGTILFFGTLGGAAGPLVAGLMFDSTGSYDLAFMILATLAFAGFVASTRLKAVPWDIEGENLAAK